MRPVNLFLTEDGVLKLGYYGLTTQADCYSIKETNCDGIRSFAPEVFKGAYEMKSDVWSLGIVMLVLMGITPYSDYDESELPTMNDDYELPFDVDGIESAELADLLQKGFEERVSDRWNVSEFMNVSVMGWRMISSIHL